MGVTFAAMFAAFFPHTFSALSVRVVRPPPVWDDGGEGWLDGEPTEDMQPLDEGIEDFSPMPGFD